MVTIVPADNITRAAILQSAPFYADDMDCLAAFDKKQRLGYVLFRCTENVEIIGLQSDDAVIKEGLLRAALNAAVSKGIQTAICHESLLFEFLEKLGFSKSGMEKNDVFRAEITSVLQCHCH